MKTLFMTCRLLLVLTSLSLPACAKTYSAKPITATVVDAETWEPLEGVNVVAEWILHYPTWRSDGSLEVAEAVTDKKGQFHIPGWGPKAVPSHLPHGTRLGNIDPGLYFFKSGYRVRALDNSRRQPERLLPRNDIPVRYSDWDGKLIWLEKFKGSLQDYASMVKSASGFHFQDCKWVKFRRWLMAMFREADRLNAAGVSGVRNSTIDYRWWSSRRDKNECGRLEEIFSEYLK
ncbi:MULTISPECIES: hypothetical protein [unclassified Methylocaldum]|jgi:hypothetical protein|uniref:hypothetical protein n=1 Tax=unclassified Methylocaldum TaxID=2622260 RepID=UPI00098B8507|nr:MULTISPECIES: hypothetical protein [unclassified Methylocaldum]MBP1149416.1 hypothetical protein [Methylocaldum sp. RMAD-M]